jgi:hypothetical protein
MTLVVLLGLLAGLGTVGTWWGLRTTYPSLEAIARAGNRTTVTTPREFGTRTLADHVRLASVSRRWSVRLQQRPWWVSLGPSCAITGTTPEQLTGQMLTGVVAGGLLPPVLWALAAAAGVSVPLAIPLLLALVLVPAGAVLPLANLRSESKARRHHVRVVVGTFVDLVVLSLAGGVGIEGALLAAAEISPDWAARRIARALHLARDTGEPSWEALSALGDELGVAELTELAATLQLAGTEGARVRQSLSARATSLRRHEQAEAESAANAMTERLFLPGALLLLGFLLFIGYPAVSRILTGF